MATITFRHILLTPLIMLSMAYIGWQLYEEYNITLAKSKLSAALLSSNTEKLQRTLTEQQQKLSQLEREIRQAKERSLASTANRQGLIIQELSYFTQSH